MTTPKHLNSEVHRGIVPTDQLGTGSADSTKYLAGDNTWQTTPVVPYVPTSPADLLGYAWKIPVRVATTAAGTLASSFENGDTVDGRVLVTGDRILIKNQAAGAENGIYVVNASGAPTRATDADAGAELVAAAVEVGDGSVNGGTTWVCVTPATPTLGSTSLSFSQLRTQNDAPFSLRTSFGDAPVLFIKPSAPTSTPAVGGSIDVQGNDGNTTGGYVQDAAGGVSGGSRGASQLLGGGSTSNGGDLTDQAGDGGLGLRGGDATLSGGYGDIGGAEPAPASVVARGGAAAGDPGKVEIYTDDTLGDSGQVLTSDGTSATWQDPAGGTLALDDLTDVNAPSPTDQYVLTWDDMAGEWVPATPAGGAPTGAAGGDLSGTYPNPSVVNSSHDHDATTAPGDPHTALRAVDFLVGTATAELSGEIVVGTSPGGELGGTWASPTVDATHSGSAHHTEDHDHDGSPTQKLLQANTHETPDTDTGTSSLHHTLGTGANQAAAGNHGHSGLGTTAPTVRAIGTSATGTGAVVPGLPTGHASDDILLLFVQSDNQTITAPAGYAQLGPQVGIGTAAAASATRLAIFWKRDGGSESDPTVADTGDHTLAQIMAVTGCPTTGDPFLSVGQTAKRTASTTGTASAGDTPADNCLVVNAFAHALDSASAVFSSPTNASLTSVTEQIDVATADGNGGGIGVITGILATAGSFVGTTVTETSTVDVSSTFVLLPSGFVTTGERIDRQVFLTAGFADTWTKPSSANVVDIIAIGGGASGSAGRNAATAAGGGGGGGGMWARTTIAAADVASTMTVTAGAGGLATANTDSAASNAGNPSQVTTSSKLILSANGGGAAGASGSGSGGLGGNGGGIDTALSAGTTSWTVQPAGGGTGGTTAAAGGHNRFDGGGAGAGGGTSQAASAGGQGYRGAGGGGGGRSNTNVGTGGGAILAGQIAGGASAGAAGTDSPFATFGGAGGAGGTSAAGPGGAGGWPGGGGGGGGSQSGAQRGGAGGDGVVTVITYC